MGRLHLTKDSSTVFVVSYAGVICHLLLTADLPNADEILVLNNHWACAEARDRGYFFPCQNYGPTTTGVILDSDPNLIEEQLPCKLYTTVTFPCLAIIKVETLWHVVSLLTCELSLLIRCLESVNNVLVSFLLTYPYLLTCVTVDIWQARQSFISWYNNFEHLSKYKQMMIFRYVNSHK